MSSSSPLSNSIAKRLIDVGLVFVKTPEPRIKVLGFVAVAAGLGLELFDGLQRRK